MNLNFRSLREENNLTQIEISKAIGRPNTSYSRWEIGQRQMDYDTLIAVADYFDVSIDYLLGRTENKRFLASLDEKENGFECSIDEKGLIKLYRQLSNEQKQYIRGVLAGISTSISSSNKKAVPLPITAGISGKSFNNIQKKEG